MAVLVRTFSSGIHTHPVSWNCAYHLRMELSDGGCFPSLVRNCLWTVVPRQSFWITLYSDIYLSKLYIRKNAAYSKDHMCSWEANSSKARQGTSHIWWKRKVRRRVHNSQPQVHSQSRRTNSIPSHLATDLIYFDLISLCSDDFLQTHAATSASHAYLQNLQKFFVVKFR